MAGKDAAAMERGFVAATHCDSTMAKAYNNLGAVYGSGRVMEAVRAMNKVEPPLPLEPTPTPIPSE